MRHLPNYVSLDIHSPRRRNLSSRLPFPRKRNYRDRNDAEFQFRRFKPKLIRAHLFSVPPSASSLPPSFRLGDGTINFVTLKNSVGAELYNRVETADPSSEAYGVIISRKWLFVGII